MASTKALDKRLAELEALMKEVIRASEMATRAYEQNQKPLERRFATLERLVTLQVSDLVARVNELERQSKETSEPG
jgi:uncharacterized coiled-coil protein SlyX